MSDFTFMESESTSLKIICVGSASLTFISICNDRKPSLRMKLKIGNKCFFLLKKQTWTKIIGKLCLQVTTMTHGRKRARCDQNHHSVFKNRYSNKEIRTPVQLKLTHDGRGSMLISVCTHTTFGFTFPPIVRQLQTVLDLRPLAPRKGRRRVRICWVERARSRGPRTAIAGGRWEIASAEMDSDSEKLPRVALNLTV